MPSHLLGREDYFKYHARPIDDLESVVKMFYLILFPGECPIASTDIFSFWENVKKLSLWENMFRMATECNYNEIKKMISSLVL